MASGSRAVMDRGLLETFVPVFILSQKKVMKLRKLEMLRSQGVTIHSCTECDYQSQYKGCLKFHLRTHSGIKPFDAGCLFAAGGCGVGWTGSWGTHSRIDRLAEQPCHVNFSLGGRPPTKSPAARSIESRCFGRTRALQLQLCDK